MEGSAWHHLVHIIRETMYINMKCLRSEVHWGYGFNILYPWCRHSTWFIAKDAGLHTNYMSCMLKELLWCGCCLCERDNQNLWHHLPLIHVNQFTCYIHADNSVLAHQCEIIRGHSLVIMVGLITNTPLKQFTIWLAVHVAVLRTSLRQYREHMHQQVKRDVCLM